MAKKGKNELDKMSFEDTIAQLEAIVDDIESGQTPLEESLERYEDGMKLISHCRDILKKCEDKIEKIAKESQFDAEPKYGDDEIDDSEDDELF